MGKINIATNILAVIVVLLSLALKIGTNNVTIICLCTIIMCETINRIINRQY